MNTEEDLLATTSILKLSESLLVELVPGDDNYLDKKTFTWKLYEYDGTKVGFTFDFDHPEYVSVGALDTMKITFFNTDIWLSPFDEQKTAITDGYI